MLRKSTKNVLEKGAVIQTGNGPNLATAFNKLRRALNGKPTAPETESKPAETKPNRSINGRAVKKSTPEVKPAETETAKPTEVETKTKPSRSINGRTVKPEPESETEVKPKQVKKPEPEKPSEESLKRRIAMQIDYLKKYNELLALEEELKTANRSQKIAIKKKIAKLDISPRKMRAYRAVEVSLHRDQRRLQEILERSEGTSRKYKLTKDQELIKRFVIPIDKHLHTVDANEQYDAIAEILEKHVGRNKADVKFLLHTHDGQEIPVNLSEKPFWLNTLADVPSKETIETAISKLASSPAEDGTESSYEDPRTKLYSIVIQIYLPYLFGRGYDAKYIDTRLLTNVSTFCVPNNADDNCFQHALLILVAGAMSQSKKISKYETSKYATDIAKEFWEKLKDYAGPMYPTNEVIADIEIILETNINIYSYPHAYPIRTSEFTFEKTSNLLLYTNGPYAHYCAILNIDAYLKPFKSRQAFACQYCGKTFNRTAGRNLNAEFAKHENACGSGVVETAYRYAPTTYDAKRVSAATEVINHVIYYDFEATTDGDKHRAYSFGMNLVFTTQDKSVVIESHTVTNHDTAELLKEFYDTLLRYNMIVTERLAKTYPIHGNIPPHPGKCENCYTVTDALVRDHDHYKEKNNFRKWLCGQCNTSKRVNKIAKHKLETVEPSDYCKECHCEAGNRSLIPRFNRNTGNFIGHYHLECLQNVTGVDYSKRTIPVIALNSSGYDNHFLTEYYNLPFDMAALPKNSQSFISWTAGPFRFLDAYRFWASSLKNMFDSLEKTPFTTAFIGDSPELSKLLKSKMVFPYEFFKHERIAEQLAQTTFPTYEEFYSSLRKSNVSMEDYLIAKEFFEKKCTTMMDFVMTYQKADVVQLADSIEFLRRSVRKEFGIEPLHSQSAPGFSFNCFIATAAKSFAENYPEEPPFQLTTLCYKNLRFFSQVRGGISCATRRYANSKGGIIIHYDVNSLYPTSMRFPMPYSDFVVLETLPTIEEIKNLPDDGEIGLQLIIDALEQTKEHQDLFSDQPPITSHLTPDPERFSEWQKKNLPENYKPNEKLLGTFLEQKGYTINYRLLKLLLKHGFKCEIKGALQYRQVPFIKDFVELGAKLRTTNAEARQVWKLVMNSVYGKFLQSELKQSSYITTSDIDAIRNHITSPYFRGLTPINDFIYTLAMEKESVIFKALRHIGAVILDDSKYIMYGLYIAIKTAFPGAKLLYTDTDSHFWQFPEGVTREEVYAKIPFDHSDLPKDHKFYSTEHKGSLGYVKDEHPNMTEFVALGAKVYSLIDGDKTSNHAKGIPSRFVKEELTFDDYMAVLNGETLEPVESVGFQTKNHVITTVTKTKKNISNFDDKRYIMPDGISTLPYGHYSLKETDLAKENHLKAMEENSKRFEAFAPTKSEPTESSPKKRAERTPEQKAVTVAKAAVTRARNKLKDATEVDKKKLEEKLEEAEANLAEAEAVLAKAEAKAEAEAEHQRRHGGILENWRSEDDERILVTDDGVLRGDELYDQD